MNNLEMRMKNYYKRASLERVKYHVTKESADAYIDHQLDQGFVCRRTVEENLIERFRVEVYRV